MRSISRFVFTARIISALAAPTLHAADRAAERLELDTYLASLESTAVRMLESEFARSIAAKGNLDPLRQIRDARAAVPRMTDADVAAALSAIRSDITVAAIPRTRQSQRGVSPRQQFSYWKASTPWKRNAWAFSLKQQSEASRSARRTFSTTRADGRPTPT